jgi:hypothetical protein
MGEDGGGCDQEDSKPPFLTGAAPTGSSADQEVVQEQAATLDGESRVVGCVQSLNRTVSHRIHIMDSVSHQLHLRRVIKSVFSSSIGEETNKS